MLETAFPVVAMFAGAAVAIALDHRAYRTIDEDADAMGDVVDGILRDEPAPARKVADQPIYNAPEQLRSTVVLGRR